MAYGCQVWDINGNIRLDTTDNTNKIVAKGSINYPTTSATFVAMEGNNVYKLLVINSPNGSGNGGSTPFSAAISGTTVTVDWGSLTFGTFDFIVIGV